MLDTPPNRKVCSDVCPDLLSCNFKVESRRTAKYNCIAFAADVSNKWWWPVPDPMPPEVDWPTNAPREVTVEAFEKAFNCIGYKRCRDGRVEIGFDRVVIFVHPWNGQPTHAAKQMTDGKWASKLGRLFDIVHEHPHGVGGLHYGYDSYGDPVVFMRRRNMPLGVLWLAKIKAAFSKRSVSK